MTVPVYCQVQEAPDRFEYLDCIKIHNAFLFFEAPGQVLYNLLTLLQILSLDAIQYNIRNTSSPY